MYFLTSSPSYEVLEQSRDELIYVYHETLSLLLQRLDYKKSIPSLVDLQVELLKHGALGKEQRVVLWNHGFEFSNFSEVILSLTTAPFLRTKNAQNTPAMQPTLYKDEQKVELKPVLKAHAGHINQQLKDYELRGLLDWGAAESKIKGLMGRFQK